MRSALRFPSALLPAILFRVPPRISTAGAAGRPLHSRLGAPPRATATTAAAAAAAASELPLSPYWRSRLEALTRPAALSLVGALSPNNPLLFENRAGNREGTLVAFAVAEKEVHADVFLSWLRMIDVFIDRNRRDDLDVDAGLLADPVDEGENTGRNLSLLN